MRIRDQLSPCRSVHTIEARADSRWGTDAQVHGARPGRADHFDDLATGGATYDRIIYHYHSLAAQHFRLRVQLNLDAEVADGFTRFDECAPDIVIADQSHLKRQP